MKELESMSAAIVPPTEGFLQDLLRDQQDLSAANRFAKWHDAQTQEPCEPAYRSLIPLTAPAPGGQYAFEVDLDTCSGCKACVTACHRLNGLDEHETWRSVGLLQGLERGLPVLRHVTTACHHCVDPACLKGCPTQAYEKDAVTGIVRHLDDQCFGCQYCILMCPYEVPQYSSSRGIVRKCDMCRQRLSENEAPACVQGCPNGAISIRIVSQAALVQRATRGEFLPTAPDPNITHPTTMFVAASLPDELTAGDHDQFHAAHAHWPLVFMLVLTQMSVGILGIGHLLVQWLHWLPEQPGRLAIDLLAAVIGFVGANLALLHLGRPLQAYRAWLGWRTSWLSREVLAFGLYVPAVIVAAATAWLLPAWAGLMEVVALIAGVVASYCSAMIYISTRRPWWSASLTLRRFTITAFVLGNSTCTAVGVWLAARQTGNAWFDYRFPLITLAAAATVAVWRRWAENRWLVAAAQDPEMAVRGCAQLLRGELRPAAIVHRICALSAGFVLPVLVVGLLCFDSSAVRAAIMWICIARVAIMLASEIADRYLFFAASVSPRMPGVMLR